MNYQNEIETILNRNRFSRRFYVRFSLACARYVEAYDTTNRAKECNDVVHRWINGKATIQEVNAASAASTTAAAMTAASASYASASASYAAYAANAAAYAAYAANAANAAAYAAAYAAYAYAAAAAAYAAYAYAEDRNKYSKKYYDILIGMINDLTEIQKEFMS